MSLKKNDTDVCFKGDSKLALTLLLTLTYVVVHKEHFSASRQVVTDLNHWMTWQGKDQLMDSPLKTSIGLRRHHHQRQRL